MPLSEYLFELTYGLCKEYPSLHPWKIEQKPFHEVIVLFSKTRRVQMREEKEIQNQQPKANGVIRRPAGDNWF